MKRDKCQSFKKGKTLHTDKLHDKEDYFFQELEPFLRDKKKIKRNKPAHKSWDD